VAVKRSLALVETGSFDGTYKDLLDRIRGELPTIQGDWTAIKLSAEVKRLIPDFRAAGFDVSRPGRSNRGSRVKITKIS